MGTLAGLGQIGQQFFSTFTTAGIIMGFVLYYILPFMPFIYFFFAVGSWVKAIFEAMVGVPLWALAHLKIQGEGLPTQSALTGYLLIYPQFLATHPDHFWVVGEHYHYVGVGVLVPIRSSGWSHQTSRVLIVIRARWERLVVLEGTINRDPYDLLLLIIYTIVVYLTATLCFQTD